MTTRELPGRIDIEHLSLYLGEEKNRLEALHDLSFTVTPGEFICILGPSGCGKSTLLGMLAGHLRHSSGTLLVDDRTIDGPSPERGLVFQHPTLLPWRNVLDNVAFGLKMRGTSKADRHRQAREILDLVGLGDVTQCWPSQLSGGMQQRVEIARVLISQPRLLLMDEPFGALDAQTRLNMQELLLHLWNHICTTVVFVTHDIDEALFLADRVLVMSPRPGRILEELNLDFPRPRSTQLMTSTRFARLKRHCFDLLRHEENRQPHPTFPDLPGKRHSETFTTPRITL